MPTLDKSICQRCFKDKLKMLKWDGMDDARWDRDKLFCVGKGEVVDTTAIPDVCKFSLEHMVATQNGTAEKNSDGIPGKVRRSRRVAAR